MSTQISKKRKFVADGVFRAELGEFFTRELAEEGYSGCEVRVTHARTEVSSLFRYMVLDLLVIKLILSFPIDHYPGYPHTRGLGGQGTPHSRTYLSRPKTFQIP